MSRFRAHKSSVLTHMQKLEISNYLSQIIYVDIAGPYPQTFKGNKYIVAYIDSFSKGSEAFAVPNITSNTIAGTLTQFILQDGCPKASISDKGPTLLSKMIELVYKNLGIKHITTTAYSPSNNAKIECNHATMNAALAHLANLNHNNWDENLHFAMLALSSAIHTSIDEAPFF